MKIVIVEDEIPAAKQLINMINDYHPDVEIMYHSDSIEDSLKWLESNPPPDAMLLDIQVADGLSFELLDRLDSPIPFVFTTAYDHYAIKAFELNSVDYLLKPIEAKSLSRALSKLKQQINSDSQQLFSIIEKLKNSISSLPYKERFLIKLGDKLKYVPVANVAYFFVDDRYTYLVTKSKKKLVVDYTLDQLSNELDPRLFFRISRKMLINHQAVEEIHVWFTGRLKLDLTPPSSVEAIVSRDRVSAFKVWLNR